MSTPASAAAAAAALRHPVFKNFSVGGEGRPLSLLFCPSVFRELSVAGKSKQ